MSFTLNDLQGNITTSANAGAQLENQVSNLAPLATTYHSATPAAPLPDYVGPKANTGVLSSFTHFIGGVASGVGHISVAAGKWLGSQLVTMAEAPVKAGAGLAYGIEDRASLGEISSQNQQFSAQLDTLRQQYKSGRITPAEYKSGVKDISQQMDNLSRQATALDNRVKLDQTNTQVAAINTAATVLTILTAGFGKAATTALTQGGAMPLEEKTAADWLMSSKAGQWLDEAVTNLKNVAVDPAALQKLTPEAQQAIQKTVAEVVANTTNPMTASQIGKTAAINLALKYPIYFQYMSSTGQELYHELDTQNYKGAMGTLAFNAALLLSGGPIGYALKWGGKVASGATAAVFGKTSFWDEASKFYGTAADVKGGPSRGFRDAVDQIKAAVEDPKANQKFIKSLTPESQAHLAEFTPETFKDFVKNLSATEATNMNATGGHDAVAAAYRMVTGHVNRRNFNDLTHISHAEGLLDMSRMSKWQREVDTAAKAKGLGPLTTGVADQRSWKGIAEVVAPGRTIAERTKAWEDLKANSASYPWANNPNVDKQIRNLIRLRSEADRRAAILNIKSGFTVKGVLTKGRYAQMAKEGFTIIKPTNLDAPFKEGTGKLTTAFSDTNDFFVKASQPLPVLEHLGGVLTAMGLSPEASQQQVYQVLNENFAKNLEATDGAKSITAKLSDNGSKQMTGNVTDYILKKLKQIDTKLPVRDYRMYNAKEIQDALGVTRAEAVEIQTAISRAYVQTPMAIRGLGDRVVDLTYATRPTAGVARRYLKIQGALRFAWNPFFNYLRLIPKTEILTEAEGGGVLRSIFSGRWGQMEATRSELRATGAFEAPGRLGNVLSGEAVDMAGASNLGRELQPLGEAGVPQEEMSANLGKKLHPTQERSIAGLINAQADRMGLDAKTYINQFPDQVRDTVQMIAEYDKKSNFINSPLARTLNIAFFPFRFETKVATIFARNLGKSDLMTQVAVVNGLLRAHTWLDSTEGQQWYSQNADAIGLFKYITPVASLNEVMQSLLPGHDHHLGNFGELGGLPFGWIPQLTDAEGWTHFNQPGVDAKTGEVFPKYVPADQKGQAAIAIQNLVGSLFSYPGATIGLTSKTSISRTVGLAAVEGNKKTDLKLVTPIDVSNQSKQYSAAIGVTQMQPSQPSPAPSSQLVAPLPSPLTQPVPQKGSSRTPRKKKTDFVPPLLPGQTSLGQL